MNILFLDWNSFCRRDTLDAFTALGHTYTLLPLPDTARMRGIDQETVENLCHAIRSGIYHFAFSFNYFPMVSEACERTGLPYLAWIYDNPYEKAYGVSILNSCNYLFTFDSAMYQELTAKGITTIYYAPLAANARRMGSFRRTDHSFLHDISFVGALYNEDHNFYDTFVKRAKKEQKEYYIGYLDALIQVQRQLYGTNILASSLPTEITSCGFADINTWDEINSYFTTPERIFADNVLCRRITFLERKEVLEKMSARHTVALYTRNPDAVVGNCHNHGYIDYYSGMPDIFSNSRINLNITLKSIQNGIPLRCMEILGSGGFLLTNYQPDFLLHFKPDTDFVYYEDPDDAAEKADYYLKHDTERTKIAQNGFEKVEKYHTFEKRIAEMTALISQA